MSGVKPREPRFNSLSRGFFIGAFVATYGFFTQYPQASFTWMFLVGAAMQLAIIFARKFLPPEMQGQAQEVIEMIADGITVLSFAIGVFGAIGATVPEAL